MLAAGQAGGCVEVVVVSVVPDPVPNSGDDNSRFRRALSVTLANEGDATVTNDPNDPGGLTRWGISQRAFPDLDIKNLTHDGAASIYFASYWRPIRGDELPEAVAFRAFDFAVNAGVHAASSALQRALNILGGDVVVDGNIGPRTIAAVNAERDEWALAAALRYVAAAHYVGVGNPKYIRGWLRRAMR